MTNFDQCVNRIISANEDNTLAIFVGAGVSKTSETKSFTLPTWNDLIGELKKELGLDRENDYLKIAQLYYLSSGGFTYYRKLKKYFPDNVQPSEIHKLIFDLNPQVVITTNWDTILENAIQQNAYIYDVICSDKDLVKSSLGKKLIKMHGDFKNHNIVFKEDDYLNYAHNFPLIENYIKSVLSTHTVLFLGYSYSDIDIKHVIKWIQSHSDVRPPMYLAVFKDDPTQRRYLENHGITTLILTEESELPIGADSYSHKLHHLLFSILTKNSRIVSESPLEVIDYIYKKVSILGDLNYVLLDQIRKTLTNCGYLYESDATAVLTFYGKILTGDINDDQRAILARFLTILKDPPESLEFGGTSRLQRILEIFSKAGLKGIASELDSMPNKNMTYFTIDQSVDTLSNQVYSSSLDFSFEQGPSSGSSLFNEIRDAFFKFQKGEFRDALDTVDHTISECLKQRQYTWLFISLFNRNTLVRQLKRGFDTFDKYQHLIEYDLTERYTNLPREVKVAIEPVYEFISFDYLYRYAFSLDDELKKKEEASHNVASGGFVFDSESYKSATQHVNLVNFTLRNCIMIDNFHEYKSILRRFIGISVARQVQKTQMGFSRIELFTCIKFLDSKTLKTILENCFTKSIDKRKLLSLSNEDVDWLIGQVLPNIVKHYLESKALTKSFENVLENTLFVIALVRLDAEKLNSVVSIILKLVLESNNSIGIYQSINLFLGIQYNLYESPMDEKQLIELIETMIIKIVDHKCSGYEYIAFTRNEISNLYGYAKERKASFDNKKLINRLVDEFADYKTDDKIDLSQSLLLSIYEIATDKVRELIRSFILKIDTSTETQLHKKFIFELSLVISEIKDIGEDVIMGVSNYITGFVGSKFFPSALYTIFSQISYLVSERSETRLQDAMSTLDSVIKKYEANRIMSNF